MILICGTPNAGKTTYSKQFDNVVHRDELSSKQRRHIAQTISEDNSICLEGVYSKAKHRIPLTRACQGKKICIWLNVDVDICVQREINGRNRSVRMVEWTAKEFEPPTLSEGWDEIHIVKNNDFEHEIIIRPLRGGDPDEDAHYSSTER